MKRWVYCCRAWHTPGQQCKSSPLYLGAAAAARWQAVRTLHSSWQGRPSLLYLKRTIYHQVLIFNKICQTSTSTILQSSTSTHQKFLAVERSTVSNAFDKSQITTRTIRAAEWVRPEKYRVDRICNETFKAHVPRLGDACHGLFTSVNIQQTWI